MTLQWAFLNPSYMVKNLKSSTIITIRGTSLSSANIDYTTILLVWWYVICSANQLTNYWLYDK